MGGGELLNTPKATSVAPFLASTTERLVYSFSDYTNSTIEIDVKWGLNES